MTFDKINRRTHLYGALVLLPWFLMYGLSSYPLAHHGAPPQWSVLADREYHLPPIVPGANLDELGARLMRENGLSGRFGAYLSPRGDLEVYRPRFLGPTRISYSPRTNRLRVEQQRFQFANFLTGMHVRGGFEKGTALDYVWGVLVDIISVAIVIWLASGLYMWLNLRRLRFWGSVALGAGGASFAIFLLAL